MRNNKDCTRFGGESEQILLSNDEDGEQIQPETMVKKEFKKVGKKDSKKNLNKDVSPKDD